MTELLRRESFKLHKWLTNDPNVLDTIPVEDRSPRFLELCENKLPTDRALGVTWDVQEDVFKFNALKQEPATTKRTILSQVFSVWDPRGLLLSFSIRSKIILQNLNLLKYGWDDGIEKITFWSDSITVLHWFHQTSFNYKAFVGNRVSETDTVMSNLETTLGAGTVNWRYAPTVDNPANDITRELHPVGLYVKHPYSAWLEFLYKAAEFCPENKVEVHLEEDKRETKRLRWVGVSQEIEPVLGWERYSSPAKLRRVLAYVMRFARNRRVKKELRQTGPMTATDLRAAQNQLVKRAQVESFGEEIRCVENMVRRFISGAESNLLIREWREDF